MQPDESDLLAGIKTNIVSLAEKLEATLPAGPSATDVSGGGQIAAPGGGVLSPLQSFMDSLYEATIEDSGMRDLLKGDA